jgi:hypothetical protein
MRNIFILSIIFFTNTLLNAQNSINISADNIKKNLSYLASDELKGRKPGTTEDSLTASFIRLKLTEYGTTPIFDKGFQRFYVVTDIKPGKRNILKINGVAAKINENYSPASFSSSDSLESNAVFAGYGFDINQDSVKWKDYDSVDVKNKWVIIIQGKPAGNGNKTISGNSKDRTKVLTAKDKGAKGILLIHEKTEQKNLPSGTFDKTVSDAGIPVFYISWAYAEIILKENNIDLNTIKSNSSKEHKSVSAQLKTTVLGVTDIIQVKETTYNIVTQIEGSDPVLKNEYIVIGGHYDHLGIGGKESGSRMPDTIAVHNGADDNASGIAGLMELAKAFSSSPNKLKRTLIFVAFSGEEMGLLGSKQFVKEPPVPLKSIKAMFNFDMIGRMKTENPKLSIGGTGTSAETDSIINLFDKDLPFKISKSTEGYGPSDHASFYKNDIPVFAFTSGVHDDYHTPFDDIEKINFDQEANILKFSYSLINCIANLDKPLQFKEAGSKEDNPVRSYKVTLGIIPDVVGSTENGLAVDGVKKGSPAEGGGIKKGDVITSMNGLPVTNIYDYMTRLNTLTKGQVIDVEVLRDGKKEILKVKL